MTKNFVTYFLNHPICARFLLSKQQHGEKATWQVFYGVSLDHLNVYINYYSALYRIGILSSHPGQLSLAIRG